MKIYVTFGQDHAHRVNEQTLDADCVAAIECENEFEGRERAFELFGPRFCTTYYGDQWKHEMLRYFPKGCVEL